MAHKLSNSNEKVADILRLFGYEWIGGDYSKRLSPLHLIDSDGYKYVSNLQNVSRRNGVLKAVHKLNPYSIYNIHIWLSKNIPNLILLSDEYIDTREYLKFKDTDENEEVYITWMNLSRKRSEGRSKKYHKAPKYTSEEILDKCRLLTGKIEFTNARRVEKNFDFRWMVDCKCLQDESHPNWTMTYDSIKSGSGCTLCGHQIYGGHGGLNETNAYRNEDEWKERSASIYLVEIYNDSERFHKIGITTSTTKRRFSKLKGYKYNELAIKESNLYDAIFTEQQIHSLFADKTYIPIGRFEGWTECFILDESDIIKFKEDL